MRTQINCFNAVYMVFAEEEDIFQSRNHVKILQVLQSVMVPLKCTQVLKVFAVKMSSLHNGGPYAHRG